MAAVTSAVVGAGATIYSAEQGRRAARDQQRSQERAIESNIEARDQVRDDLQFAREIGESAAPELQRRLTDPTTRQDIVNNDLFQALFDNAQRAIGAHSGTTGKVGDLTRDLTNASLGIGFDIYNADTNRLFDAVSLGTNAAAQQGTATLGTAANNATAFTNIGDSKAAGRVAQTNAITGGIQDLLTNPAITGISRQAVQ